MYPNQNYNYHNPINYSQTHHSNPSNQYYATQMPYHQDNDDRFFPFLAPFLLGGLAGAAVAPAFRPYPYPAPYPVPAPYPYYGPYYR